MLQFWKRSGTKEKVRSGSNSSQELVNGQELNSVNCSDLLQSFEDDVFSNICDKSINGQNSRLSLNLQQVLSDKAALAYFIQYLEINGGLRYVRCWIDIENFRTAALINETSQNESSNIQNQIEVLDIRNFSPITSSRIDHDSLSVSTDCDSITADTNSLCDYSSITISDKNEIKNDKSDCDNNITSDISDKFHKIGVKNIKSVLVSTQDTKNLIHDIKKLSQDSKSDINYTLHDTRSVLHDKNCSHDAKTLLDTKFVFNDTRTVSYTNPALLDKKPCLHDKFGLHGKSGLHEHSDFYEKSLHDKSDLKDQSKLPVISELHEKFGLNEESGLHGNDLYDQFGLHQESGLQDKSGLDGNELHVHFGLHEESELHENSVLPEKSGLHEKSGLYEVSRLNENELYEKSQLHNELNTQFQLDNKTGLHENSILHTSRLPEKLELHEKLGFNENESHGKSQLHEQSQLDSKSIRLHENSGLNDKSELGLHENLKLETFEFHEKHSLNDKKTELSEKSSLNNKKSYSHNTKPSSQDTKFNLHEIKSSPHDTTTEDTKSLHDTKIVQKKPSLNDPKPNSHDTKTILHDTKISSDKSSLHDTTKPILHDTDKKLADKIFQDLLEDALRLFKKYIAHEAQHSVECSEELRNSVIEGICSEQCYLDPHCFDRVQKFVFEKMETFFNKFFQSHYHCKFQIDVLTSGNVTLQDILYNQSILFYFMEFLEQENSRNLLEFWLAAINFRKQLCEQNLDHDEAQKDAVVLYDKYFSLQAISPLGFGDKIRFLIEENICREGGPLPNCFNHPIKIIEHILDKYYLKNFLSSQLYFKYLSELISTVQTNGICDNVRKNTQSDCSSEISISVQNTLLAMGETHRKHKKTDMNIDTRQLYDPDSLWKRRKNRRLSFGRISEMGRFVTDLEPISDRKTESKFAKAMKKFINLEENKTKEEMAWQVAEMIVKDITSVTLAPIENQS